jgi:CheY-like chemotaxis protein
MDNANVARPYAPVTIFLVEDDDVDAHAVARAMKAMKIANPLIRARDGLEALEMLRRKGAVPRPYLVLLDINMPRMNGIEFLEALRADPALHRSVVFVLTTSDDERDKMSAYTQHIAGYIVKSHVKAGFEAVFEMFEHYWRVVELPVNLGQ